MKKKTKKPTKARKIGIFTDRKTESWPELNEAIPTLTDSCKIRVIDSRNVD